MATQNLNDYQFDVAELFEEVMKIGGFD
ncbi:uncharacterized protein G2W53_035829 [Senna tora]|uniref:Uncharacterized protein n=1 Tax=Senna tora TaxID=362788 RepID=A0A834STV0_9FABA|nr:uncharacterized protein G2W53_035829 [Senna tora]